MIFNSYSTPQEFIATVRKAGAATNVKIAALDVGNKKIGIALSNLEVMMAIPHSIYIRSNLKKDLAFFQNFALENDIGGFIIGLPLSLDDSINVQAKKIMLFADKLSKSLQTAVFFEDEKYTTTIANDILSEMGLSRKKRNSIDDKIAAMLILRNFIEKI